MTPISPPGALTHPDLEELAAFLDGTLPEEDRARVMEHLADCQECYEIFAGAARFQEDSEAVAAEPERDSVVPFPPKRRSPVRRWLPLAAAALLAVALGVPVYRAFMTPPDMAVITLTAAYREDTEEAASKLWFKPDMRGGDEQSFAERAATFMLGVYLFNLQIGLEAEDRERLSGSTFPKIYGLLDEVGLMNDLRDRSKQMRYEIEEEERPPHEFLDEAAELDADLYDRLVDVPYFELGKWTAAARLAAVTRNADFFNRRDNRRFPSWFLRQEEGSIAEPKVVTALQEIQEILEADEIDYGTLQKRLETILTTYDD